MTEWGVVTVIVALVGLIATVAAPIIKLTGTINTLSGKVKLLLSNLDEFKGRYKETLEELKGADQRQCNRLDDHEHRLTQLETNYQNCKRMEDNNT